MKKLFFVLLLAGIALSCNNMKSGSDPQAQLDKNKAKDQAFYDIVFNGHNAAAIDTFVSDNFVDHNPDPGSKGDKAATIESFKQFFAAFPDLHTKVNFMVAEGDY